MKKLITILLIFTSIFSYSQTTYYTTDGKNRITESEANKMLSEQVAKMSDVMGKQLYGSLTINDTETKKDSIISRITFAISDKKPENLINSGPLSDYKNKEFPKFDLSTLSDKNFNSEKLKGKPTMINFWFTRCAPCIDEMPVLNKIKEKYKEDFNFIAITYEKKEDVEKFLEKHPFDFEHLINAKDFTDQLGVQAYPMNLFLDKNGVLKYVKGGIPYESKEGEELKMGEGNEIIEIIEKLK
ncbi:TlpA family protein disulfide reductase [Bizionia argentinensis JUB59]|uniref:TlpA family protein disulfide reductase n=1 Tax=Bizionia argentinensis JUB59 TaxID=1046627 RepID=G2EBX4_9FLAO|nr:TlpA disulfide reductase family protein [Bizionia argentinensis]EGV44100.1 TlpA family protein disulfide reductase [Bizionia argentinensis JUB59]